MENYSRLLGHAHLHWLWTGFGGSQPAWHCCTQSSWVYLPLSRLVGSTEQWAPLPGLPPVSAGSPVPMGSSCSHQHTHTSTKTHSSIDNVLLPPQISHTSEYCVRSWLGNFKWPPEQFEQEEKQHSPPQAEQPLQPGPSWLLVGSAPTCLSLCALLLCGMV